jgi:hypothetical protein
VAVTAWPHPAFLQGGGDDNGDRQPVVLTQLARREDAAPDVGERIVAALGRGAQVVLDVVLAPRAIHAGALVVGVAHPR